ncbi:hypothetical protein B7C42_07348 [Nocardia cerradoensis]|jgi:hypothetical protein|uniref:Uncharacterized protein n=1 Tax=Nocardia cerradoensis TaxID=85688 RepID=A0A231GV92_9NOCA|nr:hypothetical protein B7C42_07348 [Nocardia cerradoensis]
MDLSTAFNLFLSLLGINLGAGGQLGAGTGSS